MVILPSLRSLVNISLFTPVLPPKLINFNYNKHSNIPQIYTDASLRNNKMGIGIYDPNKKDNCLSARVLNQKMDINIGELIAVLCVIQNYSLYEPLIIYTDSSTVLHMIRCKKVKDKFKPILITVLETLRKRTEFTLFKKVKSHSGIFGNEMADRLALQGSQLLIGTYKHIELDDKSYINLLI